jgi:DNA repair exonuclease SbcCD ATPase subunit
LSYSGGSGKSFGNKGFSSQKKEKKKKQDYHKHRVKFSPEEHLSFEQLKERVSIGLDRLGNQVFSSEPGGYGFHNWMTSFNLLLDDFEEKCGNGNLPREYFDTRLEMSAELQKPVDTSEADAEIQRIEKEILSKEEIISEIARKSQKEAVEERHEDDSKIQRLKKERTQTDIEIEKARTVLDEEKKKANQSLFKRLFTGSESVRLAQEKLDSLTARREQIEENLRMLEEDRSKRQGAMKNFDHDISELRATLEDLKRNLAEVEARKQEAMQISNRRKEVTKSMSAMISSLHPSEHSEDTSSEKSV